MSASSGHPAASAFNMRYASLTQFLHPRLASQRTQMAIQKAIVGSITNPSRSLELLRQNLQDKFNGELDILLSKYITRFFQPALRNIRENERLTNVRATVNASFIASLNDVIIARICKRLLEEAAKRYTVQESTETVEDTTDSYSETRSETSGVGKRRRMEPFKRFETNHYRNAQAIASSASHSQPFSHANAGRRRAAYDAESVSVNERGYQPRRSGSQQSLSSKSRTSAGKQYTASPLTALHCEPARPASANPSHLVPDRSSLADPLVRPASANPHAASYTASKAAVRPTVTSATNEAQAMRKDSTRLDESSVFVLGSHANKALGLGAIRGKIYAKHGWLFKYVCDSEDKQWLANEASILHSSGGKAILLLRSDVLRLAETPEYRSVRVDFNKLRSFRVPGWMIQKMRRNAANVPDADGAQTEQDSDGWSPSAPTNNQNAQTSETWSTKHLTGQQTHFVDRTSACSDEEATIPDRDESIPFARIAVSGTEPTSTTSNQSVIAATSGYSQSLSFQNSVILGSDQQAMYGSHTLIASNATSQLGMHSAYHLVDSDGEAMLDHGVAVEEVVTCQVDDGDENENADEMHVNSTTSYYT